jgi:hypothetical protein
MPQSHRLDVSIVPDALASCQPEHCRSIQPLPSGNAGALIEQLPVIGADERYAEG